MANATINTSRPQDAAYVQYLSDLLAKAPRLTPDQIATIRPIMGGAR